MKKIVVLSMFLIQSAIYCNAPLKVAVFCSADDKVSPFFKKTAYEIGSQLAKHGFGLVTGGSRTGLIKEVVDGYATTANTLDSLYGVMPKVLQSYNVQHPLIPSQQLIWVDDMHTRLSKFHEISDAIIVLPGGFGTLHELMDFLVDNQFSTNKTPIVLFNIDGYWNNLLALFETMYQQNLLAHSHKNMFYLVNEQDACIQKLAGISSDSACELESHYWEK